MKILAFVIAVLTVSVFLPALQYDFVNWDDGLVVYDNPNIKAFDAKLLKYMLSFEHTMWTPLTRLSRAVDYAVWGLDPMGHHLTNILLHGFNTFLVVILVIRLIGARFITPSSVSGKGAALLRDALIAGGVTGLLFGIHPLRVESVVWVTERKDVLSAFFMLLSLLYYLKFSTVSIQKKIRDYYALSLVFFAMALMCKPIAVVVPLLLIILDLYPLERLKFGSGLRSQLKVIAEKVPFIALSLVFSIVTILSYEHEGIMVTESNVTLTERLLVSVKALCFYLYKMIWPTDLAPFYPYPKEIFAAAPEFMVPLILITGITAFCILSWKKQKLWSAVWAYYITALFPVLGIMKFGTYAAADRYTYLPSLGPFILLGLGAALIYKKLVAGKTPSVALKAVFFVPLLILFCVLSILTFRQSKIWENSITLWNHELSLYPDTVFLAYINLGKAYDDLDDYSNALENYSRAIEINPRYDRAYYNRGTIYLSQGRNNEAIEAFNQTIEVNPLFWEAYYNRGKTYENMGDYIRAVKDFHKVVEIKPEFEEAYYNLGVIYDSRFNNYQEALKYYDRAIEIKPDYAMAYNNRGIVYAMTGDFRKAVEDFSSAINLDNGDATAHKNRGHAYKRLGDLARSEEDFQIAEKLKKR